MENINSELIERLRKVRCFLFDMDGTINLGQELIPGMEDFFPKLKESGRSFYLLTNNSSKDHAHYVNKMRKLGIEVDEKQVLISTDAMINYLQKTKKDAELFVLGTEELKSSLKKAGFNLHTDMADTIDFVVVGFDQTLNYATLTTACRLIDKGVPYIATHPDVRCPIEGGEFIPDAGAFMACIETATGKKPQLITGKPFGYMVDTAVERTGIPKEEIAMVGDRLATDIAFGKNNGILSIMVLTGEATEEDVINGDIKPDMILPCAADILKYL